MTKSFFRSSLPTALPHLVFFSVAITTILFVNTQSVLYQDAWILAAIWPLIALLLVAYGITFCVERPLWQFALISAVMVFLLNYLPAAKYTYVYGATTDVAAHVSLTQQIASLGRILTEEPYTYAPGFHAFNAILTQWSGLPADFWLRRTPAFLAILLPLGMYLLAKEYQLPYLLGKILIFLSVFCLPPLYTLNGTSFAIPLWFTIMLVLLIRDHANGAERVAYSIMLIFCTTGLIFWHPSSAIITFGLYLCFGMGIFLKTHPSNKAFFSDIHQIGLLGAVTTLFYWMFHADYIWQKMVQNIYVVFNADTVSTVLIPTTYFQLNITDKVITLLMLHSRDMLYLCLGMLGAVPFFFSKWAFKSGGSLYRKFIPFFLAFLLLLATIFIVQFSSQGYKRFLFYVIPLAIIPAGYYLWAVTERWGKRLSALWSFALKLLLVLLVMFVTCLQIYPYQPMVPSSPRSEPRNPKLWIHQVNTANQYYAMQYVLNSGVERNESVWTDYTSNKQAKIFFGYEAFNTIRSVRNAGEEPGYILLHVPGMGGPYVEQLEYRAHSILTSWRNYPAIDTIYDNGLSFLLYSPYALEPLSILDK